MFAVTTSDSGSVASMTACRATAATGETAVPGWAFKIMTAPPRRAGRQSPREARRSVHGGLLRGCGQGGPSLADDRALLSVRPRDWISCPSQSGPRSRQGPCVQFSVIASRRQSPAPRARAKSCASPAGLCVWCPGWSVNASTAAPAVKSKPRRRGQTARLGVPWAWYSAASPFYRLPPIMVLVELFSRPSSAKSTITTAMRRAAAKSALIFGHQLSARDAGPTTFAER